MNWLGVEAEPGHGGLGESACEDHGGFDCCGDDADQACFD